ncbi:MAG TPA: SLC13 family permease [Chthoniobacteraceae bacterium]|nr:Gluconate transporter [Chthoniobacter sp.]HEV7867532.1 SLC13 family permease [Chthoniobacteraceae bacterium]
MSPLLLLACGMLLVVGSILWLRLHAFLALVLGAYLVALLTPVDALRTYSEQRLAKGEITEKAAAKFPTKPPAARVADEFGKTCGNLGILIGMAAIIGEAMLLSGAAESIASTLVRWLGAARAHWAFFSTSFLLCIPVMLDTVMYLLAPLLKAVARKTGRDYLLLVLCTVAGGTITHSLVPPTPGPLFVAGELGVPLGMMIGMGSAIGLGAALSGVVFAKWVNRNQTLAVPTEDVSTSPQTDAPRILPPLWLALIPVVLPVALIGLDAAFASTLPAGWLGSAIRILGDKDMALTLGALAALLPLTRYAAKGAAGAAISSALASGAVIVLIIAAGGAFGGALRQTGIAETFGAMLGGARGFALPVVFLITMLVRTAQGSATVAMITAAPVAKAFIESGAHHVHPVYFAIAIGCGSKPFCWMNDAGFWIISRSTGLAEAQTLRTVSPMMALQGFVGLVLTMICAWLFPLR